MAIHPDTNPSAIKEQVLRVVGVEATLNTCALVRDEVVRRLGGASSHAHVAPPMTHLPPPPDPPTPPPPPPQDQPMYAEDDPEVVLQNALRQLQQEEQAAEEQAAAVREERERQERGVGMQVPPPQTMMSTPGPGRASSSDPRYATPGHDMGTDLTLTPIHSDGPVSSHERPLRCPFCVNQRMLRTIKEAVEHMSTHVVV